MSQSHDVPEPNELASAELKDDLRADSVRSLEDWIVLPAGRCRDYLTCRSR